MTKKEQNALDKAENLLIDAKEDLYAGYEEVCVNGVAGAKLPKKAIHKAITKSKKAAETLIKLLGS